MRLEQSHSQKVRDTLSSCWPLLVGTSSAWLLMNVFPGFNSFDGRIPVYVGVISWRFGRDTRFNLSESARPVGNTLP